MPKLSKNPADPNSGEDRKDDLLRLFQPLGIFLCVGIALSVAIGLRGVLADTGGISSWIIPIAVSVVLGAVLAGLWHAALAIANRVRGGDVSAFWTAIGLALMLTVVQAATSMAFVASAIGGREAVRYHQEQALTAVDKGANKVAAAAKARSITQAAIAREAEALSALRLAEIAGRGPSGLPGIGPVAAAIAKGLSDLLSVGDTRAQDDEAIDRLLGSVREKIAVARNASRDADEAGFIVAFSAARTDLIAAKELVAVGQHSGISFGANALPQLQAAAQRINSTVDGLSLRDLPHEAPDYEPMSRPRAVLSYPEAVPLAWSVAVAVDALALIMLLVLLFSRRVPDDRLS